MVEAVDRSKAMELEERLAKVEARIAEEDALEDALDRGRKRRSK
jgi:hypothetical protein